MSNDQQDPGRISIAPDEHVHDRDSESSATPSTATNQQIKLRSDLELVKRRKDSPNPAETHRPYPIKMQLQAYS
jgi:hypothetical protein